LLAAPQEVSLLADLRAVVARALSGLDMFSETDGKLSPTVSGSMGGQLQGASSVPSVVPRKQTLREGLYNGLTGLMSQARVTGSGTLSSGTRHSSTGGAITPGVLLPSRQADVACHLA
jgi:hypothetical protein